MKRIAIPIHRKNYYRLLGPVVEEALRRGHRVDCWHDQSHSRRGGKASEFPDSTPTALAPGAVIRPFHGPADLARHFRENPPDVVIALDPPPAEITEAAQISWVWLQYSADIVFYPSPQGLIDADAVAATSPYWIDRLNERYPTPEIRQALEQKAQVVGVPELDAAHRIDPEEVRRRFGLPGGRPIVLYVAFPLYSNPPSFWLRNVFRPSTRLGQGVRTILGRRWEYWEHVRRGWNDRQLVEAIRRLCDRNGAILVMKSRLKDPIPRYARRLADLALYDASHYPPTILELMSVASLCVHAYSGTVFEAAYSGVPSLCLAPAARDMGLSDFVHAFVHNGALGGIYNWPGVAYCTPLRDAFDGLRRWGLEDFPLDPEARKRYVERFLGFDDGGSSARLLDMADRLIAGALRRRPS